MKNKLVRNRLPIYATGFLVGTAAVMTLTQVKKATAPDFAEVKIERNTRAYLAAGGHLRLQLGDEPGLHLAWGFPTQLALGLKEPGGNFSSVLRMEYRDLVEKETLIPFERAGEYELRAQFYACDHPGEKYCAKISLVWPVVAKADASLPKELPVPVPVAAIAGSASRDGAVKEGRPVGQAPGGPKIAP